MSGEAVDKIHKDSGDDDECKDEDSDASHKRSKHNSIREYAPFIVLLSDNIVIVEISIYFSSNTTVYVC